VHIFNASLKLFTGRNYHKAVGCAVFESAFCFWECKCKE